jgi:7-cyano-7-deazaguanine reductase
VPAAITQTPATADRRNAAAPVNGTIPSYRVRTLPFDVCYHPSCMVEAEGRRFSFSGIEALTPEVLETFPFEYAGREALVEISTDEFTAVCPYSGLPDFGTLTVRYLPSDACIELKSLKYYLTSFRSVGIYQEHAAHRILDHLVACCAPRFMEVVLDYRLRGGIHTVVTVHHGARPGAEDSGFRTGS